MRLLPGLFWCLLVPTVVGLIVSTRCLIFGMPADPYGYWLFNFVVACH